MKKKKNKRSSKQAIENMKYEIANELGVSMNQESSCNDSLNNRHNKNKYCK